jgi:hypothetical protein
MTPDDLTIRVGLTDDADGESIRRLAPVDGDAPPQGLVAIADVGGEPSPRSASPTAARSPTPSARRRRSSRCCTCTAGRCARS